MTRFDADTPTERRKLIADAIVAHRERDSAFLTVEAEPTATERAAMADAEGDEETVEDTAPPGDLGEAASEDLPTVPWVQFAEQTFNLDCTDEELDALKSLLGEYPEFRIDQLEQPDDVAGTNVRITARADPNRLAMFADRLFQTVYGRDEDYQVWIVAI